MRVGVKLYSIFRRYARGTPFGQPLLLDLADSATVRDALVEQLGIPEEHIHLVVVNGRQTTLDDPLHDGDELLVFPPVGGG